MKKPLQENEQSLIWLNNNEKKVLNILLDNSRLSDSEIARLIGISSQAVGFILKKLKQEKIIKEFTINLNGPILGINHAVILNFSLSPSVRKMDIGRAEIFLKEEPHLISLFRILEGGKNRYIACSKFKDVQDFWSFIDNKFNQYFILNEAHHIPSESILKLDLRPFYKHIVNNHFSKKNKTNNFKSN